MGQNIFLELQYDGSDYFGWQIQSLPPRKKSLSTVQGALQSALAKLFRKKVKINYASRTDRGVHAQGQCVNFKINTQIALPNIKRALNGFLPPDIEIIKIKRVPLDFHARFDASCKWYRYILATNKISVFHKRYRGCIPAKIDYRKLMSLLPLLKGCHDFSRLARDAAKYHNPRRCINEIKVNARGRVFYFDIKANGFLRHMVRNIITFLVEAGCGQINKTEARKIINNEINYKKHPAPASGLYLMKVFYEKS